MTQNQLTEIGFVVNQEDQGQQQIKTIKENLSKTKEVLEDCQGRQEKFFTTYYTLKERKRRLESMKHQVNNYITFKFLTSKSKVGTANILLYYRVSSKFPDIFVKFWIK